MRRIIGARQLDQLAERLTARDWAILTDLRAFRLLDGGQIRRLHFRNHASLPAAARATNPALSRLTKHHLVRPLERRIGGIRAGSTAYIWCLTPAGHRLLAARDGTGQARPVLQHEPSPRMTSHVLAASEIGVRLRERAADNQIELLSLETEPDCWRDYLDPAGARRLLKPDLFTTTAAAGSSYEQLWFVEVDLATESAATIAGKIAVYDRYHASGQATARHGVMPLVAWIVPHQGRAEVVEKAARQKAGQPGIHQVMALDEFIATVTETTPTARGGP
jgi:hypothetical protein